MSTHSDAATARVTVQTLRAMAARGERIAMVTAYDATFARMLDEGGADALLVGDSLGMVVQGLDSTLPVSVDDVLYHCKAVARGARRAHLVGDMPFLSYQVSPDEAVRNAGRFLAEGGVHAVKLEGGRDMAPTIRRLVSTGIPVMGHVGLTPQSVHAMGGYRVQGKSVEDAARVLADAEAVAAAGAYAVVLEGIPMDLAARITERLAIPTIGIGAGPNCDGQVLVCYDLLGMSAGPLPRFVKTYESFHARGVAAVRQFRDEVRSGAFPSKEHAYTVSERRAGALGRGKVRLAGGSRSGRGE